MDLVSPHVKLGTVTTNNQAVFINVYKRITNNYIIHIPLLRLFVDIIITKIQCVFFSFAL